MQKLLLLFLFVNLFADKIFGQVNDQENNLARQLVGAHVSKIGLTPGDLSNSAVVNTYSVPGKPGLRMVYLQQTFLGIPVFNELQVLAFNGENLVSQTGTRIIGVENKLKAKTGVPGISAVSAVQATMTHLKLGIPDDIAAREIPATARKYGFGNLGIASENITAELMWFPLDKSKKELRLVWQVFIAPKNSTDYWLVRVDANDGQVLGRQNLTITCNWDLQKHSVSSPISGKHNPETGKWKNEKPAWNYKPYSVNSASYRVIKFPAESPNHPGGAPSLHTDPWTMAPGNATSLGWHFDGIINHDSTRGNNVWAQEDRDASNTTFGKAAVSTTPQPTLSFNYLYDFTSSPVNEATNNQKASITNLFYWNNIMHDISYLYGFDEASGNFQSFNQGRGGLDEDYVVADAQDNNGSSNANFATPPDGSRPRMQMYLWTNPNPDRDGDLDNGIVAHEYSHGISNRLTGGPSNTSCLSNEEHGGEGWSDYYSLMVTTNWAAATINDGALGRGVGTYVVNQPITGQGIRNFRYSTDMAINPLVYEASLPTQVHSRGEYWCTALWEMTWEIIQQAGINPNLFNPSAGGGNAIALKLVTEGLRLQPCSPGFIDARDAILRADTLFFGGQYSCAIWKAFAKRGMGRNASQGSSESISDQVPSFLADNGTLTVTQSVTQVEEGTNTTFTNHVTAGSCSPLVNAFITDTLPSTVTYVSGGSYNTANRTVSFGPINLASLQSQDFSYTVTVNNGTYFAPQQLVNEPVAGITIPPSWTPNSSFATDWTTSSTQSHSPSNSFFAPDPIELSDHSLSTTASYTLQSGSSAYSTLSFWHRFNTEDGWDGGVVEISTNNGASWTDLGPKMIQNGYNAGLGSGSGNSLGGSKAFTGFLSSFMKTGIDLSSYSGQSVKIRFRFASDDNTAPPGGGWFVDDIELNTEPVIATRSYLFNSSSTLLTQADTITKILQSSICVPVSIIGQPADEDTCSGNNVEFTVTASGSSLNYQWEVNTGAGFIAIANLAPYVGVNSATLNIGSITTAMNNNQYRCIISNTCSADTSETVLLGVTAVAMVTAQPTEKAVCPGGSAVFSIGATGATAYQWQVDTGSGFTNLTDAGNYSGVNTDALEVSGATESMHGYQYRCVLTGCGPGVNTAAATLSIYAPLVINRQPSDTLVCSGTNANISVTATGAITGYQWQESTDGGNTFTSIAGATSPVLALNNVDISWAGKQYRCTITGSCSSIGSGAAVLGVFPAPVFNIVNTPVALCKSDSGVGLAATLGGGIWSGDGVVANKFEPSVAGIGNAEVTYTVTNAQGCTAEQSISIIVNDCSERHLALSNPQSIVIYANPSSSGHINVWIRTDLYSQLMLKVYASDGKLVGNHSLPGLYYGRHIPVDLGRLPDGVYQLFFYNEEGGHLVKKTLKLVIAR